MYGHLRNIQLRAFYFNRLCSMTAYYFKMLCILVCIVGIFFCIKLYQDHKVVAVVCGCAGGMMCYCYTVLYNHGFKLPWMVNMCRVELLERSRILQSDSTMILKRQVSSLCRVEMSMGGFHGLERSSTILFLDFVVTRICSLIIAFPGQV